MSIIKIWLGDLGAYNAGKLVGEWLSLPMDESELTEKINKYSRDGQGDYFIADFEVPDFLPDSAVKEYSNPVTLNEFAEQLDNLNDYDSARVGYLISQGESLESALSGYEDVTFYQGQTLKQVAESMVDEGLFGEIPKSIVNYIDYDAIARDLGFDGYDETPQGVFQRT